MTRLLLDINLVLDVLLDRHPDAEDASAVWSAVESGQAVGLLSAHAMTTVHYLNAKAVGPKMAGKTTEALLSVFDVAVVDEAVLRSAAAMGWRDFEDAVTTAAAIRSKCDAIVTRNTKDFRKAPIRVLSPAEAAASLTNRGRDARADS
ncbi:MAG: PIN domain-containing protein [Acidobacteria bacterium]|nr:PIN domain-containing protein [Acidobacteriota bacterium]